MQCKSDFIRLILHNLCCDLQKHNLGYCYLMRLLLFWALAMHIFYMCYLYWRLQFVYRLMVKLFGISFFVPFTRKLVLIKSRHFTLGITINFMQDFQKDKKKTSANLSLHSSEKNLNKKHTIVGDQKRLQFGNAHKRLSDGKSSKFVKFFDNRSCAFLLVNVWIVRTSRVFF